MYAYISAGAGELLMYLFTSIFSNINHRHSHTTPCTLNFSWIYPVFLLQFLKETFIILGIIS